LAVKSDGKEWRMALEIVNGAYAMASMKGLSGANFFDVMPEVIENVRDTISMAKTLAESEANKNGARKRTHGV